MRVELQIAREISATARREIPAPQQIRDWIGAALQKAAHAQKDENIGDITVRAVAQDEMALLNSRYRGKHGATDVLAFPYAEIPGVPLNLLGDIVICAPLVVAQAAAQGKPLQERWAHLVVHGTLHLCGFDHQQPQPAAKMEALEREILAEFGMRLDSAPKPKSELTLQPAASLS